MHAKYVYVVCVAVYLVPGPSSASAWAWWSWSRRRGWRGRWPAAPGRVAWGHQRRESVLYGVICEAVLVACLYEYSQSHVKTLIFKSWVLIAKSVLNYVINILFWRPPTNYQHLWDFSQENEKWIIQIKEKFRNILKKTQSEPFIKICSMSLKLCFDCCILVYSTVSIFLEEPFCHCPSGEWDNLILQFAGAEDVKLKCSHPARCHQCPDTNWSEPK